MQTQLSQIAQSCVAAIESGIPIIYLETEDMEILDRLLRSEELTEYWYKEEGEAWTVMSAEEKEDRIRPQNVTIYSGKLNKYFNIVNEEIKNIDLGNTYMNECFVAEHSKFKYYNPCVKVGYRQPVRIIGCRNFDLGNPSIPHAQTVQNLQRLVTEHISSLPGDGIRNCFYLLQSPKIQIPEGLEDYVQVITVPPISDEEIGVIVDSFVDEADKNNISEALRDNYIKLFRGFSYSKIVSCLRRVEVQCGSIYKNHYSVEDINSVAERIMSAEKSQIVQKVGTLRVKKIGDKEAAGLQQVKEWLLKRKDLFQNPIDAKRKWGIDSPKGLLLYGLPGTGKSLMAESVAKLLNCPLIQMDMGGLQSKYHGESEQNMRRMLRMAEAISPCVLWIDEIEKAFSGITGSGEADGGAARRNFATFLTWMQEKRTSCFVFATANDVNLPPELLRRGRFDQKFFTFMPTKAECVEILKSCISGKEGCYVHLFDSEILREGFLNSIVEYAGLHGKFMTGADIAGIVDDAKAMAYEETHNSQLSSSIKYSTQTFKHFLEKAIEESHPYGETNIRDIVKSLMGMAQHQFAPSCNNGIINIKEVDYTEKTIGKFHGIRNNYDELLYDQLKKTIELMKK